MSWTIKVSNPSTYLRSDYVEVNLQKLGVPQELNQNNLCLFRLFDGNGQKEEIPYQIDSVLGYDSPVRILSFISKETPPAGVDDYSEPTATYMLEQGNPADFSIYNKSIGIDHYYRQPDFDKKDAKDGYNKIWTPDRDVSGIKIRNGRLEFHISLVPHPLANTPIDYSGSITSLTLEGAVYDMLCPTIEPRPEKHWGKIYQLSFFPVPWDLNWFETIPLKGKTYDLIWSHNGNVRTTITMRSQPFTLHYKGWPYFTNPSDSSDSSDSSKVEVRCYLYRVIHTYPYMPFYIEDIFVLTEEGLSMSFRPYFESEICMSAFFHKETARFEKIPDYFARWNSSSGISRGYGFAADGHVRRFEISENNDIGSTIIRWRLPDMHHNRCINYFMFHGINDNHFDRYHEIGHNAWYEKVFKPLDISPYEMFTVAKRYIPLQTSK